MLHPYDDIFRLHSTAADLLIDQGETSLARILSSIERETSSASGHDLARYGHLFSDETHYINGFSPCVTMAVHRLLVREYLLRSIPFDCDQIIELGGGFGPNLFHLWLGGGPRNAKYISLEPSSVGRALSEKLAATDNSLQFETTDFDLNKIDLTEVATGSKVFVFSCYALAMIEHLPGDFFEKILTPAGVICGLFIEPGAWQIGLSSTINERARTYAGKHRRNKNFFEALARVHNDKILSVTDVVVNSHAPNPLEPLSIVSWSRNFGAAHYPLGRTISFSSNGDGMAFCRTGWSTPESWGVWTDGPKAVIRISLEQIPSKALTLSVKAMAFVHSAKRDIPVKISANGTKLGEWNVASLEQEYQIGIPANLFWPFGLLIITFEMSDAKSPMELNRSSDERCLGMGVSTVTIV